MFVQLHYQFMYRRKKKTKKTLQTETTSIKSFFKYRMVKQLLPTPPLPMTHTLNIV